MRESRPLATQTRDEPPGPALPEALLGPVDVTLWAVDRERRITHVAGAGIARLRVSADELTGRDPAEVFGLPASHPFLVAFDRALGGEVAEARSEWAGRSFHVRIAPVRDAAGAVVGAAGVSVPMLRELGERPLVLDEVAERLRLVLDSSLAGIAGHDAEGRIREPNDAFLAITGYTREELAAGRMQWSALSPAGHRARHLAALAQAARTGRCPPFQTEIERRDGSRVAVLVGLARLPGRLREMVVSMVDVSAHQRADRRLRAQLFATETLSGAVSVAQALSELLRTLGETLRWDAGAIWLHEEGRMRCAAAWPGPEGGGSAIAAGAGPHELERGRGAAGRAWAELQPIWIDGLEAGPEALRERSEDALCAGLRCVVAVPAAASGSGIVGVLALASQEARPRDAELLSTLLGVASQLGLFVERRRSEEEREATERERLRILARHELHVARMPLACVALDEDLRIASWNPAAERIFGWRAEEVLGTGPFETLLGDDVRPAIDDVLQRLRGGSEPVVAYRTENRTRDGRRIVCDWVNTPLLDESGYLVGLVAMAQDVTEQVRMEESLRTSEERYRTIVETTQEGVWIGDLAGRTTFVNGRLAQMLGAPRESLLGRSFLDFVPAAEREERLRDFGDLLRRGERVDDIRLERADGCTLSIQVSGTVLCDEHGRQTGVLVMGTDVSERRRLEAQLLQSQKMEALGRLAGGVAHDFNNLLTVIVGAAELLGERLGTSDPDRELLEEIQKASQRAAAMTQRLLTFGRQVVVQVEVLDLNECVGESVKMLRRLLGEDVDLVLRCAPGLGRVRMGAAQLDQVLLNLAVNARDAMPRGGCLTVETRNEEPGGAFASEHPELGDGAWVVLAVRDTGHGIEPNTLGRIFEPFFTTRPTGRGTGLGLATVYAIAQQSGGHVFVQSEPGRGSLFELVLPRVAEPAAAAGEPAPEPPTAGSETVLLVEDEEGVRSLAWRALTESGYRVLVAASGAEALALLETRPERVDLLATDVVMPGMSGRELAETLQARRPGLPVLYLSGYTDDSVLRHGVLADEVAFLQKPFSGRALATRVRALLDAVRVLDRSANRGA